MAKKQPAGGNSPEVSGTEGNAPEVAPDQVESSEAAASEDTEAEKQQADTKAPENGDTGSGSATASEAGQVYKTTDGQEFTDKALADLHQKSLPGTQNAVDAAKAEELAARAEKYLKLYPDQAEIHLTSDGQAFTNKKLAELHQYAVNKEIKVSTFKR